MEVVQNTQLTNLIGLFISERHSIRLFDLLNYMCDPNNGKLEIPDYLVKKLKEDCNKPVPCSFKSAIPFNTKLWKTLKRLNYQVDWVSLLEDLDYSETNVTSLVSNVVQPDSKLQTTIKEYIEIISHEEDLRSEIVKEFSQPLLFFSSINHKLKKISNSKFDNIIEQSKELSELLIDNISLLDPTKKKSAYLPSRTWEWLFPTICATYKSILNKMEIPDTKEDGEATYNLKNLKNNKAANEIVSLFSIYALSIITSGDIHNSKYENDVIEDFFDNLSFINEENACFGLINASYPSYDEKKIKSRVKFHELLDFKLTTISFVLGSYNYLDYLHEDCIEFLFTTILENKWDVVDTDVSTTLAATVNNLLNPITFKDQAFKPLQGVNPYIKSIDKDDIKAEIERHFKPGPNIDLIAYLLKNYDLELHEDDLFHDRESLIKYLINQLDEYQAKTGFIKRLNFVDRDHLFERRLDPNSFFIHSHHKYYESFSTLAINLVNDQIYVSLTPDYGDSHYPTERFVKSAETILKAGYIDLSLVFLGYGLLHTFLDDTLGLLDFWSSEHKANRFSVSQVNDFITKPEVWPRVEKAFLPFIFVISELDEDQSIHMKTWMNNLKKRFHSAEIFLLPTNINEIKNESILDHKKFPLPLWFKNHDNHESITKSIELCTKTLARLTNPSRVLWNQIYNQNRVGSGIDELSKELEKIIRNQFAGIYSEFNSNETFRILLNELSERSSPRDENFLNLYFVEWLLSTLSKKNKNKKPKEFKNIIDHINSRNTGLGKLIVKISESNESIINRFKTYRTIRNTLSHGDQLSYSESINLYGYAICDFEEIYQLNQ